MTGTGRRSPADAPRPSRSGPASVASREMSVTTNAATPATASSAATSSRPAAAALLPAADAALRRPSGRDRPRRDPATRRPCERTRSGSSTAALPTTTRATPSSSSDPSRTPPPVCTGHRHAAAIATTTSRFEPSRRAASRSTTWIQRAPAASNAARDRDRVVAVHGLAVEVALVQSHDAPAAEIDRRVEVERRHQPQRTAPRSCASTCRPFAPDFSGWNCVAAHVAALDGGDDRCRRSRTSPWRGRGRRARTSGRSRTTPAPAGRRTAATPLRTSSVFHCICGCFTPSGSRRTAPGSTPRPAPAGVLLRLVVEQLHADADAEERHVARRRLRGDRREAGALERLHAPAERADAGQHDTGRVADDRLVRGEPRVGADAFERLLRRAEVADAVVEDGDQGPASRHSDALGRRHAAALDAHRRAQRSGDALERGFDDVVGVVARPLAHVQRDRRRGGERVPEVAGHLRVERRRRRAAAPRRTARPTRRTGGPTGRARPRRAPRRAGTSRSPKRATPALSPSASANVSPSVMPTSSTVWWPSTSRSPVASTFEVEARRGGRAGRACGRRTAGRCRPRRVPEPSMSMSTSDRRLLRLPLPRSRCRLIASTSSRAESNASSSSAVPT